MHIPDSVCRARAEILLLFWCKKHDDECSGRQYQESNEQALFTTVHSQLLFEQVSLLEADG